MSAIMSGCILLGEERRDIFDLSGKIQGTDSGFVMEGELSESTGSETTYRNVTVYLYYENKTLMRAVQLGTLSDGDDTLNVSIRTETKPSYVVIYSTDFAQHKVAIDYWEIGNGDYNAGDTVRSKEELPVRIPDVDNTDAESE